jgi:peptidoglycan/xylan/chitin deacetylase (PgdA/CDA1 family)
MGRARGIARRIRSRFAPGGLALLYHRVAEVGSDPWSLSVTPRHFAEHLEIVRRLYNPLRLERLAQASLGSGLPGRPVVITFDDGYADNLYAAKPTLERYEVPATVFLTVGYLGEREFWWDVLGRLLLRPGTLPEVLRLSIDGNTYRWELGGATHYGEDAYRRHRHWSAMRDDNPTPRHSLFRSLYVLLQPLPEEERGRVMDELLGWAGATSHSEDRPLSLEEVSTLERGGLVEIGAHTVTHPLLSARTVASQRDEIQQSKARLEETMGHPVTSFAYPYGGYTAETVALVREAGFACACSTVRNTVWRRTDRFQLPRFDVEDWDGEEFAGRLSRWFRGRTDG